MHTTSMGKKIAALLVIVLLVVIAGLLAYPQYKDYEARKDAESAATRPDKPDGRDRIVVPFGEEGRLATLSLSVQGFTATSFISDVFGTTDATEGSTFILVDATFTNLSKDTFTLYPDGIFLTGANGVRYNVYHASSGGAIGLESKAIDGRDLGNGIREKGLVVYEVPLSFQPYALEVEKAGTNDTLVFELTK